MDEQQGHVIDGTARARQWRRSRSKAGAGEEEGGPRSDAPKSIASSLLVPADLVQAHITAPSATAPTGEGRVEAGGGASVHGGAPSDDAAVGQAGHCNPFLAPENADAAATGGASGTSRRGRIWARAIALAGGARDRLRPRRKLPNAAPRRRARPIPAAPASVVALGVLIAAIGVGAVAALSISSAPVRSSNGAVSGIALEPVRGALLSAAANPVAETPGPGRPRSERTLRVRTHRATVQHPRAKTPAVTAVAVRYTMSSGSSSSGAGTGRRSEASGSIAGGSASSAARPSTASSSGGGTGGSYAASGSTATGSAQQTARPTTASSARTTSAFGSSGALGPGSSPNG